MHRPPPIPRVSPRWVFAATCCLLAGLVRIAAADDTTAVVTIVDDMPAAGRLAAPATGQTLYIIDEARRAVAAVDPFDPTKRWIAIGSDVLDSAGLEEPTRPVAIGCIDSNTLALVCRMGAVWSVRIYNRLAAPGSTTPSAALLQTLSNSWGLSSQRQWGGGAVGPSQQGRSSPDARSRGHSTCNKRRRRSSLTTRARGDSLRAKGTSRLIHQLGSVPGERRSRV